jgi:hypothetical protein
MILRPARHVPRILVFIALQVGLASQASAQAFIPAAGEGTISASYENVVTRGQHGVNVTANASASDFGVTDTHAVIWYVEYGLSDRIAVHSSLPYMQVRYNGPVRHTIGFNLQPSNVDDGTYHGSFQDFYVGTRFKLVQSSRFALTPFAEVILPSHRYEVLAQAALGRDLRAFVGGAAIGGFADDVLPGLHFQTRVSFALVEKAVDIRPNRTAIDSAVGYFVTPRVALQFIETFQLTHDGIDWVGPPAILAVHHGAAFNNSYALNHDRLARANYLSFGAGVAFDVTEKIGVFATFTKMAWGENLPPPRSLIVGMNWAFHTRRSASHSSRSAGGPPAF